MSDSSLNVTKSDYVASAVRMDQYPEGDLSEIAFIGRSNVGKSSLINSLCRRHGLARISATPGKTQTINFYRISAKQPDDNRIEWFLVDLPGYGYAKAGQGSRRQWGKFIEEYILHSPRLKLVCQLIDLRHDPMASDIDMYQWLVSKNVPVQIIATKADKIGKTALSRHVAAVRKGLGVQAGDVITYSSVKNEGRDALLDAIGQILLK